MCPVLVVVASAFRPLAFLVCFTEFATCLSHGFRFLNGGFEFFFDFLTLLFMIFPQIFALSKGEITTPGSKVVAELADKGAEVMLSGVVEAEGEEGRANLVQVCAFNVFGFGGVT